MNKDEFYAAKIIEDDHWEFLGMSDDGDMMFSRTIGGVIYSANVREDR